MGKMPGFLDIEYFGVTDAYGNELSIPKCTAIALFTSGLSMLKACVDVNIMRIHLDEGVDLSSVAAKGLAYLPFFIVTGLFRLSALSIIMTYANSATVVIVGFVLIANVVYNSKK